MKDLGRASGPVSPFIREGCVVELAEWFLTTEERGNPASDLPAWCEGNRAEPLIHGATYFDQLVTEVEALGRDV